MCGIGIHMKIHNILLSKIKNYHYSFGTATYDFNFSPEGCTNKTKGYLHVGLSTKCSFIIIIVTC